MDRLQSFYCEKHRHRSMMWPCIYCAGEAKIAPMDDSARAKQVGGDHYKDMKIQPIEFAHANQLGPCETLALRYICRHRDKNGRQDVEKAIHVLELLLDLEYAT